MGVECLPDGPPTPSSPAPAISGGSYVGNPLSTTNGVWVSCAPITGYNYQWLRNGVVIPGATAASYTLQTADVDKTIRSQVRACNNVPACASYWQSSNSITVINRFPNPPSSPAPASGALVQTTSPSLSSVYSDPDGQTGYVSYGVYNYNTGQFVTSGHGSSVASGSVSAWAPSLPAGDTWYQWQAQSVDASGLVSTWTSWRTFYANIPPTVPTLVSPANVVTVPTASVVLSASASSPDGVDYQFQVAIDANFATLVGDSGWLPETRTWTAPPGLLQDGSTYYWRVRAQDDYGAASAWSTGRSFSIRLPKLGSRDYWPMWSHGPISVNEANGNAVVALPGPSYPTAGGSMGASLTYNSQSSAPSDFGPGWALSVGDDLASPPAKLIDHSVSGASPQLDAVERISSDGSSDYYTRVGSSNTYTAAPGDGSRLTRNQNGGWTLLDSDGAIYSFGAAGSGGVAPLSSAEIVDAAQGKAALTYTYGGNGKIASIDAGSGRTLSFTWSCTTPVAAALCVQGPDNTVWSYIADGQGRITTVKRTEGANSREVAQVGYDGSGRVNTIKNANDLDPTHASPGYNPAHALTITYLTCPQPYQALSCVGTVADGPTSNQTSPSATSTWTFVYHPGNVTPTPVRASHYEPLVLNDAPAAYLRLNDSTTTAADASGNGNGGSYAGSYTQAQATPLAGTSAGSSVSFAGGTISGSVASPQLSAASGAATTVEFWMYWNGTAGVMPFGFNAYDLYLVNGNFGFNTGCSDLYGVTAPTANAWHHVVAQFVNGLPSSGAKLWIDGNQQTLTQKLGTSCSRSVTSSFRLSGWPNDTGYRFGGKIDELAVYPDALSAAAIKAHYNEGLHNRTADGYTTLSPPNKQGLACNTVPPFNCNKTYYDSLGHPIENDDLLGNVTLAGWNAKDEQLWSEDADGNPTDNIYGGPDGNPTSNPFVADALLRTIGPDPDGAGPLTRPVSSSRYDETQIGTPSTPGAPLQGLQASYFDNPNLAGRATTTQTDATVNFSWPAPGGVPALSGQQHNFSVRWSGDLVVSNPGSYTFTTPTPMYKATRLTVDGTRVLDNWTSPAVAAQAILLSTGPHRLVLEYSDDGAATTPEVHLQWSCAACSPAVSDAVIPAANLRPAWFNKTSSVSPGQKISFSHFADPAAAHPDYEEVKQDDGTPLVTSYAYDSYGRVTQKVMPKGNLGRLDGQGNLTRAPLTDYATTYTYYDPGESAAPPAGCLPSSPVNQSELLKTTTPHGLAATTFVYDLAGHTLAETKGAGTTCSTYDSEGRLSSAQAPDDSAPTTYTYDPIGGPLTVSAPVTDPVGTGTVTTEYDEQGRLVHSIDSYGAEAIFRYDADGNQVCRLAAATALVSTSACPSGSDYATTSTYDDADRLVTTTDPAGHRYRFFYDSRSNLQAIQYQDELGVPTNKTFAWFDYNAAGWTTAVYNRHGELPASPSTVPADSQGSPLADYTYAYNLDGQKTQEVRTGGGLVTETTNYTYDALGRLFQVALPSGTCRQYIYDPDSNRFRIDESSTGCNGTFSPASTYTYDQSNPNSPGLDQLTSAGGSSYAYDSDGRMTTRGSSTLRWDGWDRMTKVIPTTGTTVTYGFDPLGRTRSRTTTNPSKTTRYLFDGADDTPLFETDGGGTIEQTYVQSGGFDLAHFAGAPTSGSTVSFLYYNGHGDLAAEASSSGTRTAAYTYDPFGAPNDTTPANSTTDRWAGRWDKQLDTATNLIQMGARPYDPALGRFLATDPVDGGSLNTYDYANQDSVNVYDLSGNEPSGNCARFEPRRHCALRRIYDFGAIDDCNTKCVLRNAAYFSGGSAGAAILERIGIWAARSRVARQVWMHEGLAAANRMGGYLGQAASAREAELAHIAQGLAFVHASIKGLIPKRGEGIIMKMRKWAKW